MPALWVGAFSIKFLALPLELFTIFSNVKEKGGEKMKPKFLIEAGVSIECRNCRKRTTVPALKAKPGIKCDHCGAVLKLDRGDAVAKAVMLKAALSRNDVKAD